MLLSRCRDTACAGSLDASPEVDVTLGTRGLLPEGSLRLIPGEPWRKVFSLMRQMCCILLALAVWSFGIPSGWAAPLDPAVVPLLKRAFFHGRDYFVLRSGRAEMIV
jgi:hypothetical protein